MDPLHFAIAAIPLAVYSLMLAALNLSSRPFVTTGARDIAALGIGIAGLVVAGPMELFFPEGAAARFGPWVWAMLIIFYGLCVSLTVLLLRPRLVVYNVTLAQLRPLVTSVVNRIDKNGRWTDNSIFIPSLGVHLQLEAVDWLRNVQLVASGNRQNYDGWAKLEAELKKEVKNIKVGPNTLGFTLVLIAIFLSVGSAAWMWSDKQALTQALTDMFR